MRQDHGLAKLIEAARSHAMTDAEREAQRRSFAFGNVAIENPTVTREMVDRIAASLPKRAG
jgi:hypothetical protein